MVAMMVAHGKLLTAEEAARRLGINQPVLEQLVAEGRLSAYRIGGQFLRYRAEDIEQMIAHRAPRVDVSASAAADVPAGGWRERVREFFYLHDFYLLAALLLLMLVAVLIRFA